MQEQFNTFRFTHPFKHLNVAGIDWQYIACGQGEKSILLLPGAPGLGDTAFQQITYLEDMYRIISPSYPTTVCTVSALVEGLISILTVEGMKQVHIIAGSYSGMIAQSLVRHYPHKVGKLILSHTSLPRRGRANVYTFLRGTMSLMPISLIRVLLRIGQHILMPEVTIHQDFWRSYFAHLINTFPKTLYLARLSVHIDFDRRYSFLQTDMSDWARDIFIIEADNDSLVTQEEREALKKCYPRAKIYTFQGTGHAAWITHQNEYLHQITTFLA